MQPRRILAVDDSKLMLKMYEVILRSHPLVLASDGEDALRELDAHEDIDLVFLDINMPRLGGLGLLERLRASGRLAKLAVVIVSTEGGDREVERGMSAGATAYIPKPFNGSQILDLIARLGGGGGD